MELLGVAFWVGEELAGNHLGGTDEEGVGEVLGWRCGYGGWSFGRASSHYPIQNATISKPRETKTIIKNYAK